MLALRNTIANEDLELQQRLKAEAEAARIRRAAEKQAAEPARQQHLECDRAAAEEKRRVAATEKAARLQAAEAAAAAAKAKWQEELRRKLKPRLRRLRLLQRRRQRRRQQWQRPALGYPSFRSIRCESRLVRLFRHCHERCCSSAAR